MSEQINMKSKVTPTEGQKLVLLEYREKRGMISTRQHDLIDKCHSETGLPTKYIKQWIGNQNTKGRNARKGGSQYKTAGKPRVVSGYNIFCSEVKAPEDVVRLGMATQNRWWSVKWSELSPSEKAVYNNRAADCAKSNATEHLSGEALDHRKNYLLKELANLCDDLSKAGVEVAACVVEEGEEELFTGSNIGIKFMESRTAKSTAICREFESFVHHVKSRSARATESESGSPEDVQTGETAAVVPTTGGDVQEGPHQTAEPMSVETSDQEPHTESNNYGSILHTINVTVEPNIFLPTVDREEVFNVQEAAALSEEESVAGKGTETSAPLQNVTNQTAFDILLPLSNGGSASTCDDTLMVDQTSFEAETQSGGTGEKKRKRKRKSNEIVGRAVEQLWTMEDGETKHWYQGIVAERCGKYYKIRYQDEAVMSIKVIDFKKGLKEKTLRYL